MPRLTIPDEPTSVSFTVTSEQDTFPISFSLFEKVNLRVEVAGLLLDQSAYTFSGTVLEGGGYAGGTVVLNEPVTSTTVRISRRIKPVRASNFAPSNSVPVGSMDMAINRLTAQAQDVFQALQDVQAGAVDPEVLAEVVDVATANKRGKVDVPLVIDLLASAGDGVTDCSATLARTDIDFITLPPGDYLISAPCTITRPIYAAPGSRIYQEATLTFSGKGQLTSDCRRQVFYGTGAVSGLPYVDVTWFVGDKVFHLDGGLIQAEGPIPLVNITGPNADADLQRAFSAYRANAQVDLQDGALALSGDAYISVPRRVAIVGNRDGFLYPDWLQELWLSVPNGRSALNHDRVLAASSLLR